jgi:hypothetical protein
MSNRNSVTGEASGPMIASTSAPAISNGATLTAGLTDVIRVAPGAAVTGVILTAGAFAGDTVIIINEAAAANSVTFAAQGTSRVADGVSSVIAGLTARRFVWSGSLWYAEK